MAARAPAPWTRDAWREISKLQEPERLTSLKNVDGTERERGAGGPRRGTRDLSRPLKALTGATLTPTMCQACNSPAACVVRARSGSAERVHGDRSISPVFCRAWASLSCPPSPRSLESAKADPPQPRLHQVQGKQLRCLHRPQANRLRDSGSQTGKLKASEPPVPFPEPLTIVGNRVDG